jgi:hypothetical protein
MISFQKEKFEENMEITQEDLEYDKKLMWNGKKV